MAGEQNYTLIHEEPGWKKVRWAKIDYKGPMLIMGGIFTMSVLYGYYRHLAKQRADNHDRAIFNIKNSFGTLNEQQVAYHRRIYGNHE